MQMDYDDEVAARARARAVRPRARRRPPVLPHRLVHAPARPVGAAAGVLGPLRRGAIDLPAVGADPARARPTPTACGCATCPAIDAAGLDDAQLRRARHGYYAAISYVDDRIGEVLAALRRAGLEDDTIVLFTSDHGELLGERGLWYKMAFFDAAARVPLIARAPGRLAPGRVADAGLAARPRADAARARRAGAGRRRSTVAAWRRRSRARRSSTADVVAEYLAEGVDAPAVMLRRGRHKYIWCGGRPGAALRPRRRSARARATSRRTAATTCARRCGGAGTPARCATRCCAARTSAASSRRRSPPGGATGGARSRRPRTATCAAATISTRSSAAGAWTARRGERGMNQEAFVTCAVTGAGALTDRSERVPVTPEQIADAALDAARAGAAVVHIHVRDPATGRGSRDVALYRAVVERLRGADVDAVINLTAGMGGDLVLGGADAPLPLDAGGTDLVGAEERLAHVAALRPEICTLDCGSMNFAAGGDYVMTNTPGDAAGDGGARAGAGRPPRARGVRLRAPRDGRRPDPRGPDRRPRADPALHGHPVRRAERPGHADGARAAAARRRRCSPRSRSAACSSRTSRWPCSPAATCASGSRTTSTCRAAGSPRTRSWWSAP